MPPASTTVITISRQMASGGAYIGHLTARILGYKYIEREVLIRAAEELGVDIRQLSRQDERVAGFVENLMKSFLFGTPEAAYVPPSRRPVYDEDLFKAESKIIQTITEEYNSIIIGKGGYAVLRDRPNTLHVFIHAPIEFRIKRLQSFHNVSREQARQEIEDSDHNRERFLKAMTGTTWYDARNYHLSIDAEAAGFEAAQMIIIELVKKLKKEETIRK